MLVWLRSPNPWNANNVRNVNPDGSLGNNNANNGNGAAPDCEKCLLVVVRTNVGFAKSERIGKISFHGQDEPRESLACGQGFLALTQGASDLAFIFGGEHMPVMCPDLRMACWHYSHRQFL